MKTSVTILPGNAMEIPNSDHSRVLCVKMLENTSMSSLREAEKSIRELIAARRKAKMSVSRLTGVLRELRELIKVISMYGC